ncbi:M23 family metallopeptidase, partial [Candidatus Dojkabacteria bacterium]|nr:M23 family metallopeptidase [Candidatus Dojkabacteria bacterium]
MISGLLLSTQTVSASTSFVLDSNGTSHIGWMFFNSTWDNKNGWTASGAYDHKGTDVYADDWNLGQVDCGLDIRAPFSGNVIFSGWGTNLNGTSNGYGNQVIIQADANNNFAWRGTHMQDGSLTGATHVNAGDVIGKIGTTGGTSTGCHLHSVLYKNIYQNNRYGRRAIDDLSSRGGGLGGTDGTYNAADAQFAAPFYNDGIPGGGVSACQTFDDSGVTFFSSAECVGSKLHYTNTGFYNLTDSGFNDTARSMSVQSGWSARVYNDTNRGGASVCITGTKWDMTKDYYTNGQVIVSSDGPTISSVELFNNSNCTPTVQTCGTYSANGITLFSDKTCTGSSKNFSGTGFWNLTDSGISFNDLTKSIYVQPGWSVEVYENTNRGGATFCAPGSKWDLSVDKYTNGTYAVRNGNGTISSIEVYHNTNCSGNPQSACQNFSDSGVTFFSTSQCAGDKVHVSNTGVYNLSTLGFDNTAKSMSVQAGWSVRVYSDANKGGLSQCVSGTKWDMAIDKYSNGQTMVVNGVGTVSSFELFNNTSCTPQAEQTCATYTANGITLFSDETCRGSSKNFSGTGFWNLTDSGINFNDLTKSIYVQPGWSVEVYEHNDRGGATFCANGSKWNLSVDKYSNGTYVVRSSTPTISSIQVYHNINCSGNPQSACQNFSDSGVTFFSTSQCAGDKVHVTNKGVYNMSSLGFDDVAKSMSVQAGWSVRVYSNPNKGGLSTCISGTKWDMSLDKYSNGQTIVVNGVGTVSSFELFNNTSCTPQAEQTCATYSANGITLFSSDTCRGSSKNFSGTGFWNLTDSGINFNDLTKSIYVQPGWSVQVYEDNDKGGATFCATGSKWNLAVDKYSNDTYAVRNGAGTISSIQVHHNTNCSGSLQSACQNFSDSGVTFFSTSQCAGDKLHLTNKGVYELSTYGFDNKAKSMSVQYGWSARVYSNPNKSGVSTCVTGTKWNMSLDKYSTGQSIVWNDIGTISSVELFDNPSCTPPTTQTCATYSANGVSLFNGETCNGSLKNFSGTGFWNLSDAGINFNDVTKSIYVQPGWSVEVYEHANRGGATFCA